MEEGEGDWVEIEECQDWDSLDPLASPQEESAIWAMYLTESPIPEKGGTPQQDIIRSVIHSLDSLDISSIPGPIGGGSPPITPMHRGERRGGFTPTPGRPGGFDIFSPGQEEEPVFEATPRTPFRPPVEITPVQSGATGLVVANTPRGPRRLRFTPASRMPFEGRGAVRMRVDNSATTRRILGSAMLEIHSFSRTRGRITTGRLMSTRVVSSTVHAVEKTDAGAFRINFRERIVRDDDTFNRAGDVENWKPREYVRALGVFKAKRAYWVCHRRARGGGFSDLPIVETQIAYSMEGPNFTVYQPATEDLLRDPDHFVLGLRLGARMGTHIIIHKRCFAARLVSTRFVEETVVFSGVPLASGGTIDLSISAKMIGIRSAVRLDELLEKENIEGFRRHGGDLDTENIMVRITAVSFVVPEGIEQHLVSFFGPSKRLFGVEVRTEICTGESCEKLADKRCTGCKRMLYCGKTCQRTDWPRHQSECSEATGESRVLQETGGAVQVVM